MSDSIVYGKYVVTKIIDKHSAQVLYNSAIYQKNGIIVEIGTKEEILQRHPNAPIWGSEDSLVIPGLINAHDHLGMLYKVSKVFADLEIQIHSAKISTQGGRGIDVFYVSLKNKKLLFDKLVCRVKEKISSAMLIENPEDLG